MGRGKFVLLQVVLGIVKFIILQVVFRLELILIDFFKESKVDLEEKMEICSLVGTLGAGGHLHIVLGKNN